MNNSLRPLAAEFLGTFALVFIGAGAVVMDTATSGDLGLIGIAVANAFVLAVMVTAVIKVSGAHFNPAVTVALLMAKKIDGKLAVFYIITQLFAAVVAALLIKWLYPPIAGEVAAYGAPKIASDVTMVQAMIIEAILTLFLVSAVFGTAFSSEAPKVGGFGIGMVLLFGILAGGPLTGAALNPARAFGPALVALDWEGHLAYWAGPLVGGIAAALLWIGVLLPREDLGPTELPPPAD